MWQKSFSTDCEFYCSTSWLLCVVTIFPVTRYLLQMARYKVLLESTFCKVDRQRALSYPVLWGNQRVNGYRQDGHIRWRKSRDYTKIIHYRYWFSKPWTHAELGKYLKYVMFIYIYVATNVVFLRKQYWNTNRNIKIWRTPDIGKARFNVSGEDPSSKRETCVVLPFFSGFFSGSYAFYSQKPFWSIG